MRGLLPPIGRPFPCAAEVVPDRPLGDAEDSRRLGLRLASLLQDLDRHDLLPCELCQGGASQRALDVQDQLESAWLACRWMSSTTVVLNACQARNDSGSLTPSFTGLVTITIELKRRLMLDGGILRRSRISGGVMRSRIIYWTPVLSWPYSMTLRHRFRLGGRLFNDRRRRAHVASDSRDRFTGESCGGGATRRTPASLGRRRQSSVRRRQAASSTGCNGRWAGCLAACVATGSCSDLCILH